MIFVSTQHKATEAEASTCTTLRANGTGSQGTALALPKVRTVFAGCASWKTSRIPSKMRTLFQGAHRKLRIFERRTVRTLARALGQSRVRYSQTLRNPHAIPILNARIIRRLS